MPTAQSAAVSAEALLSEPSVVSVAKKPRKLSVGKLIRMFVGRAAHPGHLFRGWRLHANRKVTRRASSDGQLALYAQLFPNGFLHYGYFEDPAVKPEDMSLSDIDDAQAHYAQLLIDLAGDRDQPVLDVGCGMGGMSRMLVDAGYEPTALTPDRKQVAHIEQTLSHIPVIKSRFEDLPVEEHRGKYGTVFTSESLQYLKLDIALPKLAEILKPGGSWIACDYFRMKTQGHATGHLWDEFVEQLEKHGWRITYEQDVTQNVLPTLRYIHMWATRFGQPLLTYGIKRLERKQPGLHHLLSPALGDIEGIVDDNIAVIDPECFATNKRYILLKIERA
jgi:cyclopropane fatty-acyl-phospholipid synthase-like methyltransferase